jgi:hypothetical protein
MMCTHTSTTLVHFVRDVSYNTLGIICHTSSTSRHRLPTTLAVCMLFIPLLLAALLFKPPPMLLLLCTAAAAASDDAIAVAAAVAVEAGKRSARSDVSDSLTDVVATCAPRSTAVSSALYMSSSGTCPHALKLRKKFKRNIQSNDRVS